MTLGGSASLSMGRRCMHQSKNENEERGRQVRRMKDISEKNTVRVCLVSTCNGRLGVGLGYRGIA